MSLIQFNDSAKPPELINQPLVPTKLKPVAVDLADRPLDTLKGQIEGMPVIVNYYQELIDGRSATHGHDINRSNVTQQYKKISRLEIRLDGDIDQDQDEESKRFVIRGSAYVPFGVVPNAGDMIAIDMGNRRVGIFQITNSKRMTAMNETVYRIEFTMVFYSSDEERFGDLESKVVEQLHFIKDYAQFGKDPVITTQRYNDLVRLAKYRKEMVSDYLRYFLNKDFMALTIEANGRDVLDPFTTLAFSSMVNTVFHPELQRIKFFAAVNDEETRHPTLWTSIAQRRIDLINVARDRLMVVSNHYYSKRPKLDALRWSGLKMFVMPATPDSVMTGTHSLTYPVHTRMLMDRTGEVSSIVKAMPALHTPHQDGFYVLSKAFYYRELDNLSVLEKLTLDYLSNKSVDPDVLAWLLSNHTTWDDAQKYFYFPICLALIQSVLLDSL